MWFELFSIAGTVAAFYVGMALVNGGKRRSPDD